VVKVIAQCAIGNRSTFAIECSVQFQTEQPSRNLVGTIAYWADERPIGNDDKIISTLAIAVSDLESTLKWSGTRRSSDLYYKYPNAVLDFVSDDIYGSHASSYSDPGKVGRFMALTGPSSNEWLDGWLAVLIEPDSESASGDRLLVRQPNGLDFEVMLPVGEYDRISKLFITWFRELESKLRSAS
jgi:hypothetical protein